MNEVIKTLPFGHYKTDHCRVEDFSWDSDEVEWDYENVENYAHLLLDSSPIRDHDNSFVVLDATISESQEEWETLDSGFAMKSIINEDDVDSDGIVDFDSTISSVLPPQTHSLEMKLMSSVKIVAIMKKNQHLKLHADNKLVPNYLYCAF